ncbi:MAG: hypothetical protein ACR2KW_10445 [Rubrobacter sp.]
MLFAVVAAVGLAAVVWSFVLRVQAVQVVNEDAFISFRYARNLLAGDGLVFNPGGERVEGITNLLWSLLLAAVSDAGGVPLLPEASVVVGILCGALVLVVALLWCYEELSRTMGTGTLTLVAAFPAPVLVMIAPGFAFYSGSGLEVALFALLPTVGLYGVCRGGSSISSVSSAALVALGSVSLGLATMTRPEGPLALGIAALASSGMGHTLGGKVYRLLATAVPGGLVVLAFTGWRLYYYGSVLPNTAYAKAGGMEVVERWGIPYLLNAVQGNWFVIGYLLILGDAILSRRFRARSLAVLLITPLWCAYLVYAGGDYMPFHRLLLPLIPAIYILAVAGFARISSGLTQSLSVRRRLALGAVVAAAVILPLAAEIPEQYEKEKARQAHNLNENEGRREVARWFRENDPNAVVARNGVGVLGYYSNVEIVDMLGLNDEHLAHEGDKHPSALPGHQSSDAPYVLSREPEYIMVADLRPRFSFPGDRQLVESPELRERYDLVRIKLDTGREIQAFHRSENRTENRAGS